MHLTTGTIDVGGDEDQEIRSGRAIGLPECRQFARSEREAKPSRHCVVTFIPDGGGSSLLIRRKARRHMGSNAHPLRHHGGQPSPT